MARSLPSSTGGARRRQKRQENQNASGSQGSSLNLAPTLAASINGAFRLASTGRAPDCDCAIHRNQRWAAIVLLVIIYGNRPVRPLAMRGSPHLARCGTWALRGSFDPLLNLVEQRFYIESIGLGRIGYGCRRVVFIPCTVPVRALWRSIATAERWTVGFCPSVPS